MVRTTESYNGNDYAHYPPLVQGWVCVHGRLGAKPSPDCPPSQASGELHHVWAQGEHTLCGQLSLCTEADMQNVIKITHTFKGKILPQKRMNFNSRKIAKNHCKF